jgi:hypothetical protein
MRALCRRGGYGGTGSNIFAKTVAVRHVAVRHVAVMGGGSGGGGERRRRGVNVSIGCRWW